MAKAKQPAKPTQKSKRGGARPNSGRKTLESKKLHAEIVAESNRMICDALPRLIGNMLRLADGGYERVEEKFAPSDADPKALVLVERKVTTADADKFANQYLIDRVLGRTRQSVEVTTNGDEPKRIVIPDEDDRPGP